MIINTMAKKFIAKDMMRSSRFAPYLAGCSAEKREAVERRVAELIVEERDLCHPISHPHLCNLFCALAIYEYDTAHGVSPEASREEIVAVMERFLAGRRRLFQRLSTVPGVFPLLRKAIPRMMMQGNGHGWQSHELDLGPRVCAFDTTQCIFATLFARHGVPELGPCFCRIDDYLYASLPGIRFRRTGTLCRGDRCCDFRFEKI